MITLAKYYRQSATYRIFKGILEDLTVFMETLGQITVQLCQVSKFIFKGEINWKELMEQCYRYGITSLPITLSISAMTSIIIASQVAAEMVKQGGGNFVGMLLVILIVREAGAVMSAFAIISMIGSSFASELASMAVGEQINAMRVLKVNPIEYLVVPRFLAGVIMMPFVFILSSFVGIVCAGIVSHITAGLSILNYVSSLWQGLYIRDIFIAMLKAAFFGGTISLISCSCGYSTRGGAKEVGIATTRAVVWSFLAIAIWDYIFAAAFYF